MRGALFSDKCRAWKPFEELTRPLKVPTFFLKPLRSPTMLICGENAARFEATRDWAIRTTAHPD
jgi:hypothetical protein